jgi:hypothetical protein
MAERVDGLSPSQECTRVALVGDAHSVTLITASMVGDYFTP